MKTRTKFLLSLAAASMLLAGCEILRDRDDHREGGGVKPMAADCYQNTCDVFLTVQGSGATCTITPDPYVLHVHKAETEIFFRITTPGYSFTSMNFHSGPLSNPRNGRTVFTWHDHNTGKAGPFKYRIELNGGCVLDPDVVNENPI